MINVTKEQIKETLERLKDYSYWMYNSKGGIDAFNKQIREIDDKKFSLSMNKDGYYVFTLIEKPEIQAIYETFVFSVPITGENNINNIEYKCRIVNLDSIPEEYKELMKKLGIIALSGMQRACAFGFFQNIHEISIEQFADDLVKLNK